LRVGIRWEKLACAAERATAAKPPSTRRVFDPCYPHQRQKDTIRSSAAAGGF